MTSEDPLEDVFAPSVLAALDARMEAKIVELLGIENELVQEDEPIEAVA